MNETTLRLLRSRDERAFRVVVEEHHQRVYRVVLGFMRSEAESEDITQEVFIQAYLSLPSFSGDSSLTTWLHRIAVNACLDALRARRRQKRWFERIPLINEAGELTVDPEDPVHPGTLLEDVERARVLNAAIARLPEQQRVAFVLCEIDGCSMKEAADIMATSPKAVESLLSRGRARLRSLLGSYYNE